MVASSSYCPSTGGDDRSISGSSDTSDTSQSDCSVVSRLAVWTESTSNQPENAGHVGTKAALQIAEKLPSNQGGASRLPTKLPRQLQEIGRQSSSDSGIASGSHSSYSGSFSSYTGSIDSTPGEDFGSVFSLPPHLAQEMSPCTCLSVSEHEYQVPTSLRYIYDAPRKLQEAGEEANDSEAPTSSGLTRDSAKADKTSAVASEGRLGTTERVSGSEHLQGPSEERKITKVAPSSEHQGSCQICSTKTIITICSACGGFKVSRKDYSCKLVGSFFTLTVPQEFRKVHPICACFTSIYQANHC